jgi:oxygen-dependent protoporphyrinogen oxidase
VRHVVVVGAGITGLTIAHRLARDAPDRLAVTVLETSDRAGGTIRSERVDGYLCEHGPQGLLDNAPGTLTLVRELGLDMVEASPTARRRYLYRGGRLRAMPRSPIAAITSDVMPFTAKLRILAEPFIKPGSGDDEPIRSFASRRLGAQVAEILVDPMISGIYAGDTAQLSMRAAFPAMWELERDHGSLFRGLLAKRRRRSQDAGEAPRIGRLRSFRDGIEVLPRTLAGTLGDRVRTRHEVTALRQLTTGDRPTRGWRVSVGTGGELDADNVVIAGHPSTASRLLAGLDSTLATLLGAIPAAPVAVVGLGYPRTAVPHALDGFGFLAPRREGLRTLGVLWESSIFPARAPAGHVLLRAIVGGAHDPDVVTLEDAELLAIVTADLERSLAISAPPVFRRIVRHRVGIPQCTLGHLARMQAIGQALERWHGLHLAGWGYRGVSVNQAVADGVAVAARLAADHS